MTDDPTLSELRERISRIDHAIVEAVNDRLELVAQIKAYKESKGIGFLDPKREEEMLAALASANRGPLSEEGVQVLLQTILDLSKREVGDGD